MFIHLLELRRSAEAGLQPVSEEVFMTTTVPSTEVVVSVEPLFTEAERIALTGFLPSYSGLTRDAYSLDLRMFTAWCRQQGPPCSRRAARTSSASATTWRLAGVPGRPSHGGCARSPGSSATRLRRNCLSTHQPFTYVDRGWTTNRTPSHWTATKSAHCSSRPGPAYRASTLISLLGYQRAPYLRGTRRGHRQARPRARAPHPDRAAQGRQDRHHPARTAGMLEELHKLGLLVPFYRVDLDRPVPSRAIDTSASLTAVHVRTTLVAQLYAAARDGRLRDPAARKYTPWPTQRAQTMWPAVRSGYLYGHHQLLGLARIRRLVAEFRMTYRGTTAEAAALDVLSATTSIARRTWVAPASWRPDDVQLRVARSDRSLAVVLSVLDTSAWPVITKTLHHDSDVWYRGEQAASPSNLLDWLGLDATRARALSEELLDDASFADELGDAYELLRRARPSTWDSVRGSTRIAMDQRTAAEVLGHAADLLQVPARPRQALGLQRLSERHQSLDRTLTAFHLSPHPQVVVGVEGETEGRILPRVLDLIGLPEDPTLFRVADYNGTDSALRLLAKYAAQPVPGHDLGDAVQLDRPFTRFLVLADAENRYATPRHRREQRAILIDAIASILPVDLRADLHSPEARTVEITTWGRMPFEFAHFTDRQLARGLTALAAKPHRKGRDALTNAIEMQRRYDPTPNVDDAWKGSGVSKPELNDELWPLLERRIVKALREGSAGPPILRAARRVQELVYWTQGQSIVLTRDYSTPVDTRLTRPHNGGR